MAANASRHARYGDQFAPRRAHARAFCREMVVPTPRSTAEAHLDPTSDSSALRGKAGTNRHGADRCAGKAAADALAPLAQRRFGEPIDLVEVGGHRKADDLVGSGLLEAREVLLDGVG
jgi:hypothetical protein